MSDITTTATTSTTTTSPMLNTPNNTTQTTSPTTSTMSQPLQYYDINMAPPIEETACSVNPWKARLALNYKASNYTTTWVSLPDIPSVRASLEIPACRKHASGEQYPTLPALVDPNTRAKVGDSFDIAAYLNETYPASGAGDLFPQDEEMVKRFSGYEYGQELADWMPPLSDRRLEREYDVYSKFNREVDLAFTTHVGLMGSNLPLDSERTKKEFLSRAGLERWEQFEMKGEARDAMIKGFREALSGLARVWEGSQGPFINGQKATYADLIVGGWLVMSSRTLPREEWEEVKKGNGGVFGKLFDALKVWMEVK